MLLLLILVALLTLSCTMSAGEPTRLGGTVTVLAAWEGAELDAFRAAVRPFEERTGIRVEYHATRNLEGELGLSLQNGTPPDVAGVTGPGHLAALARAGALVDLGDLADLATYKSETAPAFVDLGTVDDHLFGVFIRASLKGLIWYVPESYRRAPPESWAELQASTGPWMAGAPATWCVGLESGSATGWPGTDWIEDILLRQSGVEAYDAWVSGRLRWTSPEVRRAFRTFGGVVADGAVFGGPEHAASTPFSTAHVPLFTTPAGCSFYHQASFLPAFLTTEQLARIDFFPFPAMDGRAAGAMIGGGDLLGLLRDRPQGRALISYLVSAEAQAIWVSRGGSLSANTRVREYPDQLSRRMAAYLTGANRFRFDGSDMMPAMMATSFLDAVSEFTRDQTRLPSILEGLDAAQAADY